MTASLTQRHNPDLEAAFKAIEKSHVLVGVPQANAQRDDDAPVNNAWIGYMNEFGYANVPPRPWLHPAIKAEQNANQQRLSAALQGAFTNLRAAKTHLTDGFNRVGLATVNRARRIIDSKIPPPLAASTVEARIAKRPALQKRVDKGEVFGPNDFTPLVDTGAFKKSINYVVVD